MIRKLVLLGVLTTLLASASAVYAEDVYATVNGKRYHKESCRLIQNKKAAKIDKDAAIKNGVFKLELRR